MPYRQEPNGAVIDVMKSWCGRDWANGRIADSPKNSIQIITANPQKIGQAWLATGTSKTESYECLPLLIGGSVLPDYSVRHTLDNERRRQ